MSADPRKVVSEDGTPIAVAKRRGSAASLIHGAAADHNRWAPVLAALEERLTVFAIDRRGRGLSGDATDYALEREYEDVVAVVESAGARGERARALLRRHLRARGGTADRRDPQARPIRAADGVPEVTAACRRPAPQAARGRKARRAAGLLHAGGRRASARSGRVAAVPAGLGGAARRGRHDSAGGAGEQEYVFDPDRFRDLDVPTLYLQGGDSSEPFKAAGEALRGALPDCRVAVMPGQRHAAMDTATDLFTAQVLSFLEAPDRAR